MYCFVSFENMRKHTIQKYTDFWDINQHEKEVLFVSLLIRGPDQMSQSAWSGGSPWLPAMCSSKQVHLASNPSIPLDQAEQQKDKAKNPLPFHGHRNLDFFFSCLDGRGAVWEGSLPGKCLAAMHFGKDHHEDSPSHAICSSPKTAFLSGTQGRLHRVSQ